ncbi:MAG: hypothetical protein GWO24_18780, partial [Akkermansiaceae bacterium]|nr:hypothetical protein [Akkermansiaceae bacterium]
QTEYYQLYDFLNQTADADRHNDDPNRALPSPFHYAQHRELVEQIAAARAKLAEKVGGGEAIAKDLAELERRLEEKALALKPPPVPVMQELPGDKRRQTHFLVKGDFLSPGEEVSAAVPEA